MRIWFFNVPIFKLMAILGFFLIPLLTGYAVPANLSPSGLGTFVGKVIKFWLEALYWLIKSVS